MTTETITYKNTVPIRLKSGETILAGTACTLLFNQSPICELLVAGSLRTIKVRCINLPLWFNEIERPDLEELSEFSDSGLCPSILGNQVEPDGYDEHGAPSWMIALGLI